MTNVPHPPGEPPCDAPRAVVTLHAAHRCDPHDSESLAMLARRLAALFGCDYAGEYDPARIYPRPLYFVPDETLALDEARALGIAGEDDLFGGVVPHAFVATKVISHGTLSHDARVPPGWSHALAARLGDAVLPGYSAFDPADLLAAAHRLLAHGPVRIKQALARGGGGQCVVDRAEALPAAVAALDPDELRRHGAVVERNLPRIVTGSVGQVHVGGVRIAYVGTQRQIPDRDGNAVYGGSTLDVVRGDFDALDAVELDPTARLALVQARRYDRAVSAEFPGFFASRRNYDVACGEDSDGRMHCGVLEQSWRIGGASPAEIAALEAFARDPDRRRLRAACYEVHEDVAPPPLADLVLQASAAERGPLLKYAILEQEHGHPTRSD